MLEIFEKKIFCCHSEKRLKILKKFEKNILATFRPAFENVGKIWVGGVLLRRGVFPFRVVWTRWLLGGGSVLITGGIIVFSKKFCARIL